MILFPHLTGWRKALSRLSSAPLCCELNLYATN
jgi:hypothetical protein